MKLKEVEYVEKEIKQIQVKFNEIQNKKKKEE